MISEAFFLGLSSGPACLFTCAPVLAPFLAGQSGPGAEKSWRDLSLFLLGRLLGYLFLGAVLGAIGSGLAISKESSSHFWSIFAINRFTGILIIRGQYTYLWGRNRYTVP